VSCTRYPGVTKANIVTICQGRLEQLKITLPSMLNQACCEAVIVVAYGDKETARWCESLDLSNLITIEVLDKIEMFNLSRARNIGGIAAFEPAIAFVDCDVQLGENWLMHCLGKLDGGRFGIVVPDRMQEGIAGTIVTFERIFYPSRGYDEALKGYGIEDVDFMNRCRTLKPGSKYDHRLIAHLEHGQELRTANYPEKDVKASKNAQKEYLKNRVHVNPKHFGKAVTIHHEGSLEQLPEVQWIEPPPIKQRIDGPALRREAKYAIQ